MYSKLEKQKLSNPKWDGNIDQPVTFEAALARFNHVQTFLGNKILAGGPSMLRLKTRSLGCGEDWAVTSMYVSSFGSVA